MDARYEEKTFESYFNNELDRKTSIYFPICTTIHTFYLGVGICLGR